MDTRSPSCQRDRGFTLVELLIVVAILGILSAIAVPMYKDYVLRARMTEAFTALGAVGPAAEEYWNNGNPHTYSGFDRMPAATANFGYTLSATASAYTVTATGKATMANFVYTIDQNGARTSSGPTGWGSSTSCWIDRKGSKCSQ